MKGSSTAIRLNPFKGADGPQGIPVPWSPWGRMLPERPSFTLDPLLHAGCYYVQDSSAMFPGYLLRECLKAFDAPVRVLDLCAAPGGKTTDLAASLRERFAGDFLLVSNEVIRQRAAVLDDNVARWGDPAVAVTSVDPAAFAQLGGFFDIIVADVPCSGEGMFRKDARAQQEWSPAVVELCAARQKRILSDVWPVLREGGLLIYSTCTYEEAENDANLEWAAQTLGGDIFGPEAVFGLPRTRCGHLLKAGDVPGEGQWAGVLRKTAPAARGAKREALARLHPLRDGIARGEKKGGDFIPSADYALSYDYAHEWPEVEVDLPAALRFLHRDSFPLEGASPGYNLLTYRGHPLGFVKNLGKRCNNLHPASRRILMNLPL